MRQENATQGVQWIDHYVVPVNDSLRWGTFMEKVVGGHDPIWGGLSTAERLRRAATRTFYVVSDYHHIGGFLQEQMLPPTAGLGREYPRYGFYIRPEDVEQHLRRLDEHKVEHSDAVKRSDDGEEGTAIYFQDPDGNQYEFWAPVQLPSGAMECTNAVGVGRISHAVFDSTDLNRTAGFYSKYLGVQPIDADDIPQDTLALRLLGGGRLVFKRVDKIGPRTGGHTLWSGIHAALTVREGDLMPTYQRMWAELPELPLDAYKAAAGTGVIVGEGARTELHPLQQRGERPNTLGRGTEFYDWDNNNYHLVSAKFAPGEVAHYRTGADPLFN